MPPNAIRIFALLKLVSNVLQEEEEEGEEEEEEPTGGDDGRTRELNTK